MSGGNFWSRRPTRARAWTTALAVALLAIVLAVAATRFSTFSTRSNLALDSGRVDELYLTPLAEDPARVILTTVRENANWARDQARQPGDYYWVRRYGDPSRPGLPDRLLLTSRSRGAHLLVPIGALDLEHALAEVAEPPGTRKETAEIRCELRQVYWGRSFAGLYLHLRLPEREIVADGSEEGQAIDFDFLIVRGNELCTTDFLLQPNGELYRSALADGLMPAGPFRRNPATGDESIWLMRSADDGVPLYSPVSLFDELVMCWRSQLPIVVDDRWRLESVPAYELVPPPPELRARVAWNGVLHLAARFEPAEERRALEQALARFQGS